jgi:HPt (histidine-containing phosphotransfer) domain-containing protein
VVKKNIIIAAIAVLAVSISMRRAAAAPTSDVSEGCQGERPVFSLQENLAGIFIGNCMRILRDESKLLTLQDILSGKHQPRFFTAQSPTPSMSFTPDVFWIEITLDNPSGRATPLYLEHRYPMTDYIRLYSPRPSGGYDEELLGDRTPFSQHKIKDRYPVFSLTAPPGKSSFYVRYDNSTGTSLLAFALWSPAAYENHVRRDYQALGLLFGIILAMGIFNTFIAVSMKSRTYIYYVAYMVSFLAVNLAFQGFSPQILPEGWISHFFQEKGMLIAVQCCFIFGCAFTIRFLGTQQRQPIAHIYLKATILIHALDIILILLMKPSHSSFLANALSAVSSVALIAIGVSSLIKKYKPAIFYTLGWSSMLLGNLGLILKYQGVLPVNLYTEWGQSVGGAMEVIFLSLALGSRINFIRNEAETKIRELNRKLQDNLSVIERIVEERTEVIATIVNNVKSGFLLIDRALEVQEGFTKSCEYLLATDMRAGRRLVDLLELKGRAREHFESVIEQIFDDALPEAVTLAQLPCRYCLGERTLALEASVVRDRSGKVFRLLFTINDSTRLVTKEKESLVNSTLLHIIRYKSSFVHFMRLTRESLKYCRESIKSGDFGQIPMLLHTIKGNCAVYQLTDVVGLIHGVEEKSKLAPADIDAIEGGIRLFLNMYRTFLQLDWDEEHEETFNVKSSCFSRLCSLLPQRGDSHDLVEQVKEWIMDTKATPAINYLGPIEETVERLAHQLGKKVKFSLEGGMTLLTFPLQEKVMGNLIHLIRNAIDHGIESNRLAVGKPEYGRLTLSILKSEDRTTIMVADDGRGIDVEELEKNAIKSGKVMRHHIENMSVEQKIVFILSKGVTTKEEVTEISGRGVGVAALINALGAIGGLIEVQTAARQGCVFKISIPHRAHTFFNAA